jgi:hypothetical protein
MRSLIVRAAGATVLSATLLAGCNKVGLWLDKLGLSNEPQHSAALPSSKELKRIHYMSQSAGPGGRQLFDHLEQARSCHDLEIAMRWNRPSDVKSGPFNDKMVYLSAQTLTNLPKNSEVFLTGVIKAGRALPSGGSIWSLKLKDDSEIQAIETPEYAEKQAVAQQAGGPATIVHPYTPGRTICGNGVYQGNIGIGLDPHQHVPLVSILFTMDRRR